MKYPTGPEEPVETALAVLAAGWATPDEIANAVIARRGERPALGQLLLNNRKLTMYQTFAVLEEQANSGKLFGSIAVELGYVKQADVDAVLQLQSLQCPPLLQVLEERGIVTSEQAETIASKIQARIRPDLEATLPTNTN